jgi:hypothetical protein
MPDRACRAFRVRAAVAAIDALMRLIEMGIVL